MMVSRIKQDVALGRVERNFRPRGSVNGPIAVLCALLLGGCAALTGANEPAPDTYQLSTPVGLSSSPVRSNTQLLVVEPSALKAVDSENIVIQTEPLVIQYLGQSQWSDRLPKLVQRRLADGFESTGRFAGVGLPGQGLAIDYQLLTEIRQFGINVSTGAAKIVISAKIVNDRNGAVLASRVFDAQSAVIGSGNAAYVSALDRAFADLVQDMVSWVTGRL